MRLPTAFQLLPTAQNLSWKRSTLPARVFRGRQPFLRPSNRRSKALPTASNGCTNTPRTPRGPSRPLWRGRRPLQISKARVWRRPARGAAVRP